MIQIEHGVKVKIIGDSSFWGKVQIGSIGTVHSVDYKDKSIFVKIEPKNNEENGIINFPFSSLMIIR